MSNVLPFVVAWVMCTGCITTAVVDGDKYPNDDSHGGHYGTTQDALDAWKGEMVMWNSPDQYDVTYTVDPKNRSLLFQGLLRNETSHQCALSAET